MVACVACALAACGAGREEPHPPADAPTGFAPDLCAPLGEVSPRATVEQRAAFLRGRELAERRWTAEDGLGPGFNAVSCVGCHERPAVGGTAARHRNTLLARRVSAGTLQAPSLPVEGVLGHYDVVDGLHALPADLVRIAIRNPSPLFGTGLIAQIPSAVIFDNADEDDADGDGISGRFNLGGPGFVGRFARKASHSFVDDFVRAVLFDQMGVTSLPLPAEIEEVIPGVPRGYGSTETGCISGACGDRYTAALADDDAVMDPELSGAELLDLVTYVLLLAPPCPDAPTPESEAGRRQFATLGCDGCHLPALESPAGPVGLYSDLLLHDMGEELADGIADGRASEREFRTQPLWGVAASRPYLHDGRADTLDEAIRWHGGEATAARDRYLAASAEERALVITFLESLGGRSQRSDGLLTVDDAVPSDGELGAPRTTLSPAERAAFERGRVAFDRDVRLADGLGPSFNADSCRACHAQGAVGGAGSIDMNMIRQGEPGHGAVLHRHRTTPTPPPVDPGASVIERVQAPLLFGVGLVDAIPDAVILANADPTDEDGDGVRGRPHRLDDGRLGRFGWRAAVPDLTEVVRRSLSRHEGLTVPVQDGLSFGEAADGDDSPDPEVGADLIDDLVAFVRGLAPPAHRPRTISAFRGESSFADVGCGSCHRVLTLADGAPVYLYSDLLLHDVLPPGEVGVGEGNAHGRELRTPPLWGLSTSAPFMHDGRSPTIEDAIARHDGEAAASAAAFASLSTEARADVLAFLRSL